MRTHAHAQHAVALCGEWEAEVLRLLEEQHLVAWASRPDRRVRFGADITRFMQGLEGVEVCTLHGRSITGLDDFCSQLERSVPGPALERRISGRRGLVSFLRAGPAFAPRRATKFRFFLWHDADVLIAADRGLFSRLVEALSGVAAEAEYVADDALMIQRVVLTGGEELAAYADDASSACRAWQDTDPGGALWRLATGLEAPAFAVAAILGEPW